MLQANATYALPQNNNQGFNRIDNLALKLPGINMLVSVKSRGFLKDKGQSLCHLTSNKACATQCQSNKLSGKGTD